MTRGLVVHAKLKAFVAATAHAGDLEGADVRRACAEHPVCGDEVQFAARCAGDRIVELRWRAIGCPATMAVTALAATVLQGAARAGAASALRAAIAAHGGLDAHERHAEAMVERALAGLWAG